MGSACIHAWFGGLALSAAGFKMGNICIHFGGTLWRSHVVRLRHHTNASDSDPVSPLLDPDTAAKPIDQTDSALIVLYVQNVE